jgi:parallel beta-helix repeat protein
VVNNTSNYNGIGIDICDSAFNLVSGNTVANNGYAGIESQWSNYNEIVNNKIVSNWFGIYAYRLNYNKIYHNNFLGNQNAQVLLSESDNNTWDDGYPSGGNYWSNYTGVGSNHDGIGDTAYTIDTNNTDNYPLMRMFSDFNATLEQHVQTICNSTISDFQYNGTAISFNVSGEEGASGFCRLIILHALLSPPYNVTVNNSLVAYTPVFENDALSIIYINYTLSTKEIVIVPEFPSILILPLFMTATLLVVIFFKRRFSLKSLQLRAYMHR